MHTKQKTHLQQNTKSTCQEQNTLTTNNEVHPKEVQDLRRPHGRRAFDLLPEHVLNINEYPKSECSCRCGGQRCTCMYDACKSVGKRLHMLPSHPTLGEPKSFSWGTLTNRQTAKIKERLSGIALQQRFHVGAHYLSYSFHPSLSVLTIYASVIPVELVQHVLKNKTK